MLLYSNVEQILWLETDWESLIWRLKDTESALSSSKDSIYLFLFWAVEGMAIIHLIIIY